MIYKMEHIRWKDLLTISDRVPIGAIEDKPAIIDVVGYNIKENDEVVCLAHQIYTIPRSEALVASEFSIIPKSSIISRKEIK